MHGHERQRHRQCRTSRTSLVQCAGHDGRYSVGGTIEGLTGAGLTIEDGSCERRHAGAGRDDVHAARGVRRRHGLRRRHLVAAGGPDLRRSRVRTGAIAGADVTNVSVDCIDNVTDPLVGTYAVLRDGADDPRVPHAVRRRRLHLRQRRERAGCGDALDGNGVEYGVYAYDATTGDVRDQGCRRGHEWRLRRLGRRLAASTGMLTVGRRANGKILTLTVSAGARSNSCLSESKNGEIYGSFADAYQPELLAVHRCRRRRRSCTSSTRRRRPTRARRRGSPGRRRIRVRHDRRGAGVRRNAVARLQRDLPAPAPGVAGAVDTNGTSGLSHVGGTWTFGVDGDELRRSDVPRPPGRPELTPRAARHRVALRRTEPGPSGPASLVPERRAISSLRHARSIHRRRQPGRSHR